MLPLISLAKLLNLAAEMVGNYGIRRDLKKLRVTSVNLLKKKDLALVPKELHDLIRVAGSSAGTSAPLKRRTPRDKASLKKRN